MSPGARSRLQLVASAVLFSTGGAAIKECRLDSWEVAGLRALVAAVALLTFLPAARRGWSASAALVGVAYAVTVIVFVRANKMTTALSAIFLQATSPLYIVLLGPLLLGERVRRRDLVFMAMLAAGLALFFVGVDPPARTAPQPLQGNILALVSGLSCGFMMMGLRHLGRGDTSESATAAVVMGNVIAFVVTAPAAFPIEAARPHDYAVIAYLGVFQIAVAYVLLVGGLRHVTALEASLLMFVEPVLSPAWAWLVHGETAGPWSIVGGAVILLATAVHAWNASREEVVASGAAS